MTESSQSQGNPAVPPDKPRRSSLLFKVVAAGFVIVALLAGGYELAGFKGYQIPVGSMEPTLQRGDYILAVRFSADQKPERGNVVIFTLPNNRQKNSVKRIVGLPGEKLEIKRQQVYINKEALDEPYAQHKEPPASESSVPRDDFGPLMIPEGHVFILGDNRENSYDSRQFGTVKLEDISRKARWVYWSWDPEENNIRWERIGNSIE